MYPLLEISRASFPVPRHCVGLKVGSFLRQSGRNDGGVEVRVATILGEFKGLLSHKMNLSKIYIRKENIISACNEDHEFYGTHVTKNTGPGSLETAEDLKNLYGPIPSPQGARRSSFLRPSFSVGNAILIHLRFNSTFLQIWCRFHLFAPSLVDVNGRGTTLKRLF